MSEETTHGERTAERAAGTTVASPGPEQWQTAPGDAARGTLPELKVVVVDDLGRLELGTMAAGVGWVCEQILGMTVEAGAVLRLSDLRGAFIEGEGLTGRLDCRCRLLLPGDVGARTGLVAGVQALAFITVAQGLAVLPTARLVPSDDVGTGEVESRTAGLAPNAT